MALATSCPRCQTSFRVVPDQLKARRGLVRCGTCNEVFSGIDTLRYVDEPIDAAPLAGHLSKGLTTSGAQSVPPLASSFKTDSPAQTLGLSVSTDAALGEETRHAEHPSVQGAATPEADATPPPISLAAPSPPPSTAHSAAPSFDHPRESFADLSWIETAQPAGAPPTTPTEGDWPAERPGEAASTDTSWTPAPPRAVAPLSNKPDDPFDAEGPVTAWNLPDITEPLFPEPPPDTPQYSTPSAGQPMASAGQTSEHATTASPGAAGLESVTFLKTSAAKKPLSPAQRRVMTIASLLLTATLVMQAIVASRDWLAAWMPNLAPALSTLSAAAGLPLQAPRALDALTLESFELQAANTDEHFTMRAMLRNRARHSVRWPAMELSLTDSAGAVVARKVLVPADYLPGTLSPQGVPASSEQAIQISLQTFGLKPTGYNVKLFYP